MSNRVKLQFNGQEIEVEKGTYLIEAAKQAGAEIPHFCYHPKLKYDANCRMCIVDIEKMPKLQTSCSTVATEGMVVWSNTPRVKEAQNGVMAFLLGNHPLDCPECDQGGECQLQDFAHRHSPSVGSFTEPKRVFQKEYFGPMIEKEMNRCVSCLRCVRYCDEVIDSNALGSIDRGSVTEIGGFAHHALDCEFCGGCIQICPVGAMTSRLSMYEYRSWQTKKTNTICTYCGDGCQMSLETINDKVIRVSSELGIGRNEGDLCARGFFGYGFVNHKDRLSQPLLRQNEQLRPVTWDTGLKKAVSGLQTIKEKYGPEAIGGIISSHCTNEEVYLFHKLMREVIGTPHVDSGARYGYVNAVAGLTSVFGTTRLARYEDVVGADVILSFAGDMAETNPIAAIKVKEAVRKNGAKLICVDSFNQQRDVYKSHLPHIAHRHLQVRIGTEGWAIMGLLKALVKKATSPLLSSIYLEGVKQATTPLSFEAIEQVCGIGRECLEEIAALYAESARGVLIIGRAIIRNLHGYQNVVNLANLAMLAGQVAKPGAGILALAEENNELGAIEMLGDCLPGEASVPKLGTTLAKGKSLVEMIDAVEAGEIRALYIVGENPVRSLPQKKVKQAFQKLDLLICQELFLTETAVDADVVLPAVSFAEKGGRYTNQEGEIQKIRKAIDPIEGTKPDWTIFSLIAERLGTPFWFKSPDDIWRAVTMSMPAGWGTASPEGVRSHITSYCSAARALSLPSQPPATLQKGEFYLQMGQSLYHSGKMSTQADGLNMIQSKESVYIHPDDAVGVGVVEGETVSLSYSGGEVTVPVLFSRRLARRTLFFPEHFSLEIKKGFPLTLDPVTRVPYGDYGIVRVSKVAVQAAPAPALTGQESR
jgi:formate dehydrogenase alpha subunit